MNLMTEYTGFFVGGPDDGNSVTVSRPLILVSTTSRLWLNGDDENADIAIVESKGEYNWDITRECFVWKRTSSRTYIQLENE